MAFIVLPAIGSTGKYTLKFPFDSLILKDVTYTCRAIRRIEDVIAQGEDAFETYYQVNNITKAQYDVDANNGECIVSLQSGSGQWIHVPSSYILTYPSVNGVNYRGMIIALSLGAIPDTLDLSAFEDEIKDFTLKTLGIRSKTKVVAVTGAQVVANDSHKLLETVRVNTITNSESIALQLAKANSEKQTLLTKIQELEKFIRLNITP